MKRSFLFFAILVLVLALAGCELVTEEPDLPKFNPADHLVINEVFTLPIDHPTPYSWIELYNPTADTIDLTGWTLSYQTVRLSHTSTVEVDTLFTFIRIIRDEQVVVDTIGVFDVPFATYDTSFVGSLFGFAGDTVKLPPNGLFTIVSSEEELLDHIAWGPGDERYRVESPLVLVPGSLNILLTLSPDTTYYVDISYETWPLFFLPTDQLILKDPTGEVKDVVRYGNYVYQGPSTNDPFLNNHSTGVLPEFQSIQRYAGAYSTKNTANDFYVSSASIVPTPQWYSQVYKR